MSFLDSSFGGILKMEFDLELFAFFVALD